MAIAIIAIASSVCHGVTWTGLYSGEFIVSRRRITAQPPRLWTYLRDIAVQPHGRTGAG